MFKKDIEIIDFFDFFQGVWVIEIVIYVSFSLFKGFEVDCEDCFFFIVGVFFSQISFQPIRYPADNFLMISWSGLLVKFHPFYKFFLDSSKQTKVSIILVTNIPE